MPPWYVYCFLSPPKLTRQYMMIYTLFTELQWEQLFFILMLYILTSIFFQIGYFGVYDGVYLILGAVFDLVESPLAGSTRRCAGPLYLCACWHTESAHDTSYQGRNHEAHPLLWHRYVRMSINLVFFYLSLLTRGRQRVCWTAVNLWDSALRKSLWPQLSKLKLWNIVGTTGLVGFSLAWWQLAWELLWLCFILLLSENIPDWWLNQLILNLDLLNQTHLPTCTPLWNVYVSPKKCKIYIQIYLMWCSSSPTWFSYFPVFCETLVNEYLDNTSYQIGYELPIKYKKLYANVA